MCLSTMDSVPTFHTTGFKFFERKDSKTFIGRYGKELYKVGLWYEDKKELTLSFYYNGREYQYQTGFHYLTEIPDMDSEELNKMCYDNKEIIALIEVKDIIATGTDSTTSFGTMKAGVCKRFRIKKILYGKMSDLKQFIKFKLPDIYKELASFYSKYKDYEVKDSAISFYDIALKDSKSYFDTVNFIDLFNRNSKLFKFFTSIHFHALKNNPIYEKMYWHMIAASSPAAYYYHGYNNRAMTSPALANEFVKHFQDIGSDSGMNYRPFSHISSFERNKCHRILIASYLNKINLSLDD